MRHKIRRHDLGDGVLYAVAETPDLTLLVVNDREVVRRTRRPLARWAAVRRVLAARLERLRSRRKVVH